jgi:hypothetical protein
MTTIDAGGEYGGLWSLWPLYIIMMFVLLITVIAGISIWHIYQINNVCTSKGYDYATQTIGKHDEKFNCCRINTIVVDNQYMEQKECVRSDAG